MPAPVSTAALTLGRPVADIAAIESIDDVKDVLSNIVTAMGGMGWPSGAKGSDVTYQNVYYRAGDFWGGSPDDPLNPDLLMASAGGTIIVQEEGAALTARGIINFIGASVTAVDNAGATRTDVTIAGGTSNSFETIRVSGMGDVVADSAIDILTLVGGQCIAISTNAGSDTIEIAGDFKVFRALVNDATDVLSSDTSFLFDNGASVLNTATSSGTAQNAFSKNFVDNEEILVFGDPGGSFYAAKLGTESFKTIAVSGQSSVVADSPTDTLTLVAGSNVTLTTNATTDTVTITAAGGGTVSETFKTIEVFGQDPVVADGPTDTLTLVAGTNMTITTNETTDTITFTSAGSVLIKGMAIATIAKTTAINGTLFTASPGITALAVKRLVWSGSTLDDDGTAAMTAANLTFTDIRASVAEPVLVFGYVETVSGTETFVIVWCDRRGSPGYVKANKQIEYHAAADAAFQLDGEECP